MEALAKSKVIEVQTINKNPQVGEYGVYSDSKIWKAIASQGSGVNYSITFERETSKERMTLKAHTEDMQYMWKLTKPTGYIPL